MLDKFNLYDLLGYIIPGGLALLLVYGFGLTYSEMAIPNLNLDLGASLLLVGLSYVFGHLIATAGEVYEKLGNARHGRLSEQFLDPSDDTFSAEFKELIRRYARKAFGFDEKEPLTDPNGSSIRPMELFNLCWAHIVQKTADAHTAIYLAISGLSRAMMIVSGFGAILSLLLLLKQIGVMLWAPATAVAPWKFSALQLAVAVLLLFTFALTTYVARFHYIRFRTFFAKSVYENFVGLWATEQPAKPARSGTGKGFFGHLLA